MPPAVAVALLLLTGAAAVADSKTRRIPNALTGAGILAGLLLNTVISGWAGLRFASAGLAVAFGLYLVLYSIRAMGAGDVKLMAGVGALSGMDHWFAIFLVTSIIGGVAAVLLSVRHRQLRRVLWNVGFIVGELSAFRAPFRRNTALDVKSPGALTLPHAVSIAAGTVIAVVWILLKQA